MFIHALYPFYISTTYFTLRIVAWILWWSWRHALRWLSFNYFPDNRDWSSIGISFSYNFHTRLQVISHKFSMFLIQILHFRMTSTNIHFPRDWLVGPCMRLETNQKQSFLHTFQNDDKRSLWNPFKLLSHQKAIFTDCLVSSCFSLLRGFHYTFKERQ